MIRRCMDPSLRTGRAVNLPAGCLVLGCRQIRWRPDPPEACCFRGGDGGRARAVRGRAERPRPTDKQGAGDMEHGPAVADLESFLARRGEPLLRTAMLLTGSKEAGEDLLQAGLERLLRHWHRIEGDPEGYLRRTLYNLAADGWRQQRAWRGRLRLLQNGTATSVTDGTAAVDTRDALIRLLTQLPPRLRELGRTSAQNDRAEEKTP